MREAGRLKSLNGSKRLKGSVPNAGKGDKGNWRFGASKAAENALYCIKLQPSTGGFRPQAT
jgi:hypothetical protein